MDSKKKFGLTVLSLLLWAQLVFSVGLTVWRYWLIQSGEFDVFVSASSTVAEPLYQAAEENCPDGMDLVYLGDEPNFYYTRYRLFPKRLVRQKSDWPSGTSTAEIGELIETKLRDRTNDVCLLVDRAHSGIALQGEIVPVNSQQSLHIYRK